MKPVQCEKCQLFYDADEYAVCPHCQQKADVQEETSKKSHGWLKGFKKVKAEKNIEEVASTTSNDVCFCENCGKPLAEGAIFCGSCGYRVVQEEQAVESILVEDPVTVEEVSKLTDENKLEVNEVVEKTSLKEAVKDVQDYNDQKTVAFYDFDNDIEPVVGWLVCIKGQYKGSSFTIVAGNNSIGRSLTNSIALAEDTSISRNRHASIVYEPNHKQFYLQPGESSGLTYINGELLLSYRQIFDRDRIEIGKTEFMFVQLCNDEFSWNDFKE